MQMLLNRVKVTPDLRVCDIMRSTVVKVAPDATARQGAALLAYYGLTSVPVVERVGRLVGVVSASDILHLRAKEVAPDASAQPDCTVPDSLLDTYRIREIMLPALFTVEPTATLCELAELVERTGTEHLLVVADGNLCGMVTTVDLLRALSAPPQP